MLRSDIGSEKISEKLDPLEHPSAEQAYILTDNSHTVMFYLQFLPQTTLPIVLYLNIEISSIYIHVTVFSVHMAFFINKSYREILL